MSKNNEIATRPEPALNGKDEIASPSARNDKGSSRSACRDSSRILTPTLDQMGRFFNGAKALQFHRVIPEFQVSGTWNRPNQFEDFLNFLNQQGIKPILPGENKDGVIITFDDGEENIYCHAFPILKKFGMKALVFLVVNYIGKKNFWDISLTNRRFRHLSWEQIIEMKDWGIEFGSHGMTHQNLTRLSLAELEYELRDSKRILEKNLGLIDSISYPFNRTNNIVLKKTKSAGFKYGFGGDGSSNLSIKKEAIYITDTIASLKIKIFETPALAYQYERIKQKFINYFTIATMLNRHVTV